MKHQFELGQLIFVHEGQSWFNQEPTRDLKQFEITSLNGKSLYAKPVGAQYNSSVRFNRKTLKSESTMVCDCCEIIVDVDAFHEKWDKKERVLLLKDSIQKRIEDIQEQDEELLIQLDILLNARKERL